MVLRDAERVAKTLGAQHALVVSGGGDGTLCEVVNGLLHGKKMVPLGYVPLGSTNDFAGSLGLPNRVPKALDGILNGGEKPLDVGCFNGDRYFTYIASFGAFTATSYTVPQATKNALGHFAYVLEGARELATLQPYRVTVEADDRVIRGEFLFGSVCNSTSVAGMVKLDPDKVDMGDGLFEVILVRPPKNADELGRIIGSLYTGDFDPTLFEFFKTRRAVFKVQGNPSWSLDGDEATGTTLVTIENLHHAFTLRK